ncbi:LacI family DNA-binding transcriptional regulator [Lentzea albida]|uniref:Transcriptional regulator, LacI family n=1 Tax=Lentzea albida TaxID=65499 RepID=A0A1H9MS19_9PSEU|nr:LacI family DNA-binding transcriptional regulator [Lentzea albida]SER25923.1 transcriptional regulator, LacI family [Lentzea albida]
MAKHQTSSEAKPAGATIYDVAGRAGVSIATVSRVLQGATVVAETTRQKVLAAVEELGYVPLGAARSLAVRHHEAHGLVLPELSGPYYAELLMGFEARAAELAQSIVLVLTDSRTDLAAAVRQLATRVDAIAVLGSPAISGDVVRLLRAKKPVVVIAGEPHDGVETIAAENLESARELAGHVLGHGRERALFVGDPDTGPDIRHRYAGFVAAHEERGLVPAEPVRVALSEADGTAFAQRLLRNEYHADALICANDELALSIMTTLQDAGRDVPGEIAVTGWDDVMTSRYVRPGLTTVRQPVQELGALAANRLHELVSGEPPQAQARVLPTQLVVRSSCGCPPA